MRVLIVGGGIAGLATAIGLRQQGIESVVFERAAADRDEGSGLMLAPNALSVLERLGLYEEVRRLGHAAAGMAVLRADGTPIRTVAAEVWQERYGYRSLIIDRKRLHEVLRARLGPDGVRSDCRLIDFDTGGQGVRVRLSNGQQLEGDVLVGADGLRSEVRQRLFGPTHLRYSGQTSWRAIADHDLAGSPLADRLVEIWSPDGRYRFGWGRVDERRTYYFVTYVAPAGERDPSTAAALARLQAAFADYPAELHTLLGHTARLVRTDIFDFKPLGRWHRGPVVLVGDAAHATTPNCGQGACQAIESAYVLAKELASRPPTEAFLAYEKTRMAKAHYVTRLSWRLGRIAGLGGPLGRWLRYSVTPRLSEERSLAMSDRLFHLNF